jgi:phosphoribosyl-ATP pyrophosphohydrolase
MRDLTNIISLIELLENELTGVTHASIDLQLQEALNRLAYLRNAMDKINERSPKISENQILTWAEERGLLGKNQNPVAQASKTIEEASETLRAVIKGDRAEVIDGIGDVWVTLVILAAQHDTTLIECQQAAWEQIKSRKGTTVNGLFIKDGGEE